MFFLYYKLLPCVEKTEYWCGVNVLDGAVTAIQTQLLVLVMEPDYVKHLKVGGYSGLAGPVDC